MCPIFPGTMNGVLSNECVLMDTFIGFKDTIHCSRKDPHLQFPPWGEVWIFAGMTIELALWIKFLYQQWAIPFNIAPAPIEGSLHNPLRI